MIVLNVQQLESLLSEFVAYDNRDRPHRSLPLRTPEVTERAKPGALRYRAILRRSPLRLRMGGLTAATFAAQCCPEGPIDRRV